MKKLLLVILLSMLAITKVNAHEMDTIVNLAGVEITTNEYEKLKTYWSENVISNMNRKSNTYYVKTETLYGFDKNIKETKNEIITKEEYDSVKSNQTRAVCGAGCWETTYKTIQIELLDLGSTFNVRFFVTWKILPAVRSTDFIGVRWNSNYSSASATHQTYYYNSNGNMVQTIHSNSDRFSNGWIFYIIQPTETNISNLEHYLNITGIKSGSVTAWGTFQHATRTISISTLLAINPTISSSGLGGVVQMVSPYNTYYDNMQGVNITW